MTPDTSGARDAGAVQAYRVGSNGTWESIGPVLTDGATLAREWAALVEANRTSVLLFRDRSIAAPDVAEATALLRASRGEVVHAGTSEYAAAMPCLRFTQPAYLALAKAPHAAFYSSPELTMALCLVERGVLERATPPCAHFATVHSAGMALGWDWFHGGVIVRAARTLCDRLPPTLPAPVTDQLHFTRRMFGGTWVWYVAARLLATGHARLNAIWRAMRATRRHVCHSPKPPLRRTHIPATRSSASVAVLIPTVDRVAYLRAALEQLRHQTHAPAQVVVVDQTPADSRDSHLERDFADLPLTVVRLDAAGQSSARNAGIRHVNATWTLLLDDDIDFPSTLIAQHVALCEARGADVSVGVATEDGVPPLPEALRGWRPSPVLMGGNSLVRTALLREVGAFDLAFDGGSRADGDLGVRLQRAGALMLLDGGNSLHHHHAPRGGLRVHKARTVTRASSRQRIFGRHPVVATELYICLRYFGEWALHEVRLVRLFSQLRMDGSRAARLARLLVGTVRLWPEWRRQAVVVEKARELFRQHPTLETVEQK